MSSPSVRLERVRVALRSPAVDRATSGAELAALAPELGGRFAVVASEAAALLGGGAARDIEPAMVDAIVVIALDDVAMFLEQGRVDDDALDAHLQALRSLAPIPGVDFDLTAELPESDPTPSVDEPPVEGLSPDLVATFVTEARELLSACETGLLELDAGSAGAIHALFRALHSFKGNCGFLGFDDMERLAHRAESLLVELKEGRRKLDPPASAALFAAFDALSAGVDSAADGGHVPRLAVLVAAFDGAPVPEAPTDEVAAAPIGADEEAVRSRQESTLRVDVGKVDQLLDLVGELIIASTAIRHVPAGATEEESLARASGQLDRVVRSLQDVAMSLRMVPVRPTFQRMVRVVRDVSQRLGKPVELHLSGDETEIDKTVAELVTDPLVHLVRNAIDHGLETPEQRVAAGKPRTGHVRLSGSHVGGEVWIRVEDDGKGLDRAKIVARAVERGIVTADAAERLTDAEVFAFIFEPGFSTAAAVTDVSGRGVGMDVVRRNLEMVKGRVDVKSVPGQGATFTLRIPLTLAIIEGMLVRVGTATFTVPLLCIRESVVIRPQDVTVLTTWQEMVRIRGELLPVVRLHRLYDLPADHQELHHGILVVVEDGGQPLCLFVDELIGQRQTVIKALSGFVGTIRGVAGCTVLGDGRISLILDVPSLVGLQNG
ncbi:MAG: chemotaxis protein CheA [Myxococcota bacterium]